MKQQLKYIISRGLDKALDYTAKDKVIVKKSIFSNTVYGGAIKFWMNLLFCKRHNSPDTFRSPTSALWKFIAKQMSLTL